MGERSPMKQQQLSTDLDSNSKTNAENGSFARVTISRAFPTTFCRSIVWGNHSSLPMPLEEGSRFGKNTARLLFELRLQLRHDVET
ncbi:unnamed protein product [Sphagnum balticum]